MSIDVTGAMGQWIDVYAASGHAVGTPLLIHRKSGRDVLLEESAASPLAGSMIGIPLRDDPQVIDSGALGCWAMCVGAPLHLSVQVYVP